MNRSLKKAAALRYNQETTLAPKMTALGKGMIAEEIIQKAKAHNVPTLEDPTLVELLAQLNVNEAIPEELFEAVAEIFAFIYHLDQQVSDKNELN